MNPKVNSTPKTAVMPVRLCDLNLSDIEDYDDDEDNKKDATGLDKENEINSKDSSYKAFEQIKMKFSGKALITPLKHSNICTPQLQSKKAVFESSSKLNRRELYKSGAHRFGLQAPESPFTIKENEVFSTPHNNKIDNNNKSYIKNTREPQKLLFSPACSKNRPDVPKDISYGHNSKQIENTLQKSERSVNKSNNYFGSKSCAPKSEVSSNNFLDDYHSRVTGIYEIKNSNEDTTFPCDLKYTQQNIKELNKEIENNIIDPATPRSLSHANFKNIKEIQNNTKDSAVLHKASKIVQLNENETISKTSESKEIDNFKIPVLVPQPDKDIGSFNKVYRVQVDGILSKICLGKQTYDITKKLGSGGSSVVYLGVETDTLEKHAIKIVNLSADPSLVEGYMNEVQLLSRLQGSDVVIKMLNYVHVPNDKLLYMVMECGETDFSHIIKTAKSNNEIPFPIVILVNYWLQMLEAVKFIHDNGIIHSDLKPANFLKVGPRLKLIDFGIASSISNDCTSIIKHVQTGTFNYMSPEALQDTSHNISKQPNIKISFKSDVWSLGCILYLLLYGNTPFGHLNRYCVKMAAITDPNSKIDFPELDLYPSILVKTARRCLVHNPYERPTVAELLQLPREPFKYPENNL